MMLDKLERLMDEHRKKAYITCDDSCFCFDVDDFISEQRRSAEHRDGAAETQHSGLDREQDMYECGNCGVPRFVHNGILEACRNCGDDETELSLYDDVP